MQYVFPLLQFVEDFAWGWIGFPCVVLFGLYCTWTSRCVQLRRFPTIVRTFIRSFSSVSKDGHLHPIRAYFASIGGSLGIGNVVAVSAAIHVGGPGTLLWIWVTALVGSLVKYAEVYLGMTMRVSHPRGSFVGGPMIFLRRAFRSSWPAMVFCILLCMYGVEMYQFGMVASLASNLFGVPLLCAAVILFAIIVIVERGGFHRVGAVASYILPCMVGLYCLMSGYVLFVHYAEVPALLRDIVRSAWSVRSAQGAFVGSSMMLALSTGVRRGCYSTDVGIGYASIVHSTSSAQPPARQASLLIFEVFMDTFLVCTTSVMLVLITGVWTLDLHGPQFIQMALAQHLPGMHYFVPLLLMSLGYSTTATYFAVGMHTAEYISPAWGRPIYYIYACVSFLLMSCCDSACALSVMSLTGCLLLVVNTVGMWRLRRSLSFDVGESR